MIAGRRNVRFERTVIIHFRRGEAGIARPLRWNSSRWIAAFCVKLFDGGSVSFGDDVAFDFSGGGQFATGDGKLIGKQSEVFDGLVSCEPMVDAVDIELNHRSNLRVHHEAIGVTWTPVFRGPSGQGLMIEGNQCGEVSLAVANDHAVGDPW